MTTMLSRSGQTDPSGKMTNRLDIPMSDDLHDLIVVKASEAVRPKSEYARDLIVQALSAPMLIGLPDETRGQLASLAQMAGVSPNDLAVRLLSDVVSQKFSMAQSFVRQRLLEQWEDNPDTVGGRS